MMFTKHGALRIISMVIGTALILPVANARMYQWEQAQSGRIQLSGHAPSWYRSVNAGPRVLVFDNGKLVDDTAIKVSEIHRQFLREQALGSDALEEPNRPQPLDQQASLQQALTEAAKAGLDVEELAANATQQVEQDKSLLGVGLEEKVNELKALLSRWDAARTEQAQAVINGDSSSTPQP